MLRDVLSDILNGSLSVEEAEDLLDNVLDSADGARLPEALGLSNVDWTAYAHGAGLGVLARWRRDGWPTVCPACGDQIVPEQFGWTINKIDGLSRLKHIRCPITRLQ